MLEEFHPDDRPLLLRHHLDSVCQRPTHIGFALAAVQADALARYHRLLGDDTRFQTGTDDNALKNVQATEAEGNLPQAFVDRNAARFFALREPLALSIDRLTRRDDEDLAHHLGDLLNCTVSMIVRYRDGLIPAPDRLQTVDRELYEIAARLPDQTRAALDAFDFRAAAAGQNERVRPVIAVTSVPRAYSSLNARCRVSAKVSA